MKFKKLDIKDLIVIKPEIYKDERGFFLELHNKKEFKKNGISIEFVQDNFSYSKKNVLRGLHFQNPPHAQDKLVWVTKGKVLDVVVDIRKDSKTYGKWSSIELSEENKNMLFIPKGFAHGFAVLSNDVCFQYKVSDYYEPECDGGIIWNDKDLAIAWGIKIPIISKKDQQYKSFKDLDSLF